VQSVSVHIAVLAVGKDGAPTQTISELAAGAGHQIVARATVSDTEPVIRAQLKRWIDDANIDVVIVSGTTESENASGALKPLITQMLPGFTDVFRFLSFQDVGASAAMHSNAEAAQCTSTFVFVLPASVGAVKGAMEQLILPQLDPNTTPKNLVGSMPRIRNLSDDGIPMPIVKEKTASGAGMTPKSPAMPVRHKQVTGANVIRMIDPEKDALFDPPTKPIDVEALEKQIALSETPPNDSPTKVVDLSRLPKVPPGADPLPDDTDQIEPGDLPPRNKRLESEPIEPPLPPRKDRKNLRTEPAAVVPPAAGFRRPSTGPAKEAGLIPDPPAPRGAVKTPASGPAPIAPLPSLSSVPRARAPSDPPATPPRTKQTTGPTAVPAVIPKVPSGPMSVPSVIPKSPSGPIGVAKQPSAPAPKAPPTPPPVVASSSPPSEPVRRKPSEPPPPPPERRKPSEPPPLPRAATAPPAPPRARTSPPVPPRQPTGPAATVKPEPMPEVVAAVALPPPRPPTNPPPDLAALTATPIRRSTGELPSGTFNYPVKHSSGPNKLVIVLAALAVLSAGFVAVLFLFPDLFSKDKGGAGAAPPPAQKPEVVASAPVDAAPAVIEEPPPPDIDIVDPTPGSGSAKRPDVPVVRNPTPTGTRPPRGNPPSGKGSGSAATGEGSGSQEDTVENAPNNPPPSASDCDEVSCVLAKYDRPCCEKFRPKDSDIKPRGPGGIPAELDKSMVRAGIEKVKPRVVACGEKATDKGTVKVSVSVRPDGSVSDTSVVSSPNPDLGECVVAVMKKAEFGKSVAGGSFVYPFVF